MAKKKVAVPVENSAKNTPPDPAKNAASTRWRGLLDAFLSWLHSSSGDEAQATTEGSAHQEQRYLEEANNTQQHASPQLSEYEREFLEAEADRVIDAGPSITKLVEDYQKFDRYLSTDVHKDYIKVMSSCPPGMEVCTGCYFERDNRCPRPHSNMIAHFIRKHGPSAGVKCKNCSVRFRFERHRDLHGVHCNV